MGNLNSLFTSTEDSIRTSKIVGIKKSGVFVARIDNVNISVMNTSAVPIKIGDTVLLNKSDRGKFYITGKTDGLSGQNNIEEIFRNG